MAVSLQVGQGPEERGVVHMVLVQHAEGVHDQAQICVLLICQPQFVPHVLQEPGVVGGFIVAQSPAHVILVHDWQQGPGQVLAVIEADLRLAVVGVAAGLVGVVGNVAGVEIVQEGEGAVIEGVADDRHVVAVHNPMAEAHGLPVGNHPGGALHDFLEPSGVALAVWQVDQVRKVQ